MYGYVSFREGTQKTYKWKTFGVTPGKRWHSLWRNQSEKTHRLISCQDNNRSIPTTVRRATILMPRVSTKYLQEDRQDHEDGWAAE